MGLLFRKMHISPYTQNFPHNFSEFRDPFETYSCALGRLCSRKYSKCNLLQKRVLALAALIHESPEILNGGSQDRFLWVGPKGGVKTVAIGMGTMAVSNSVTVTLFLLVRVTR